MKFFINATSENIDDYLLFLQKYKFEHRKGNSPQGYIVIDSLEELLEMQKSIDKQLIISGKTIEIYDDYRE